MRDFIIDFFFKRTSVFWASETFNKRWSIIPLYIPISWVLIISVRKHVSLIIFLTVIFELDIYIFCFTWLLHKMWTNFKIYILIFKIFKYYIPPYTLEIDSFTEHFFQTRKNLEGLFATFVWDWFHKINQIQINNITLNSIVLSICSTLNSRLTISTKIITI